MSTTQPSLSRDLLWSGNRSNEEAILENLMCISYPLPGINIEYEVKVLGGSTQVCSRNELFFWNFWIIIFFQGILARIEAKSGKTASRSLSKMNATLSLACNAVLCDLLVHVYLFDTIYLKIKFFVNQKQKQTLYLSSMHKSNSILRIHRPMLAIIIAKLHEYKSI